MPEESLNLRQWHRRACPDRGADDSETNACRGPPNTERSLENRISFGQRRSDCMSDGTKNKGPGEVTRPETVAQVPRPDLGVSGNKPDTHFGPRDRSATQGTELASDGISGYGDGKTLRKPQRITP
ncbi:hypothetical protein NDU88_001394 [Pleurodeles waltl]|uniref:Uncharacterized protein n=1 Tax=Pleurodeles waltl TaxID=8319 RepID=A0AAV7TJ05_PLEWA|nr:hypothetical protein NDU88_001394 [Pleurodeles waltl]